MRTASLPPSVQALAEVFGDPISVVTRADLLADGSLVDVSETAREAGFRIPVAVTRAVWADCVEWTDEDTKRQRHQDEDGRLWDLVWMAFLTVKRAAARQATPEPLPFQLYRVERGGRKVLPRLVTLQIVMHGGDAGEPVFTVMLPDES